ncbi:hypothetical protein BHAOGJBA_4299 [Methylobacterium hispanicum]|uniref:Uncharacterized protein n=1 Tax=Methylobacterium hispanicum TaxID=270350 RepID=A0AAV4ZQL4_9HYPH|nr:hypothetical protein [Methylobacterium hispanicum]GJD90757.1 hypothetical protein BHAOGJBA_4299 [Methylobacterium hispanicum]
MHALSLLLRHQVEPTGGRAVADELARRVGQHGLRAYSPALHSIAHCCDGLLTNPTAMPAGGRVQGGSIADTVVSGEALVVFADAHPRRGHAAAQVWIRDVVAAHAALSPGPRAARAAATARRISRATVATPDARPSLEHQRQLIDLAALILDAAEVERLQALSDCVPVVAIIGDTRATGQTGGRFYRTVMRLPGAWLGTAPTAGRA